uniref:Uncharacterized protein n=1 Tax=Amphimedon queenslandica TaxID=400682 RepID=A0A1X7U9N5_AMPQE
MSYTKITDDNEFYEAVQSTKDLRDALKEGISQRKDTIKKLRDLRTEVKESYDKHKKAIIGGTVATVTGSALGIAGFVSGFFTFGVGFGLAIAGGALAAAGGTTIAGSQIGYHVISGSKCKDAQKAIEEDTGMAAKIEKYGAELDKHLKSLSKKHNTSEEGMMNQVKHYISYGKLPKYVGAFTYNAGKFTEFTVDGIKTAVRAATAGRAAVTGARLTANGLRTAAGILRVGSVALDVIFIPIDLGMMLKAAYDVHEYKKTGASNSNAAQQITEWIIELKKNLKQMEAFLKECETEV